MTLRSAQIRSSAVFFGVVLALAVAFAGDRGVPAKNGIGNFGQVNERLYRGAEPDAVALKKLQQMGVKAIVDLRNKPDVSAESGQAALNGLVYTNIPMRGLGRPGDDEVARVLDLIETLPSPVFVHCQHGCDRTGTIVACYRIRHDGWLNELALREAETYGISRFERGMRSYILKFPKPPKTSPESPSPAPAIVPVSTAVIAVPATAQPKKD